MENYVKSSTIKEDLGLDSSVVKCSSHGPLHGYVHFSKKQLHQNGKVILSGKWAVEATVTLITIALRLLFSSLCNSITDISISHAHLVSIPFIFCYYNLSLAVYTKSGSRVSSIWVNLGKSEAISG